MQKHGLWEPRSGTHEVGAADDAETLVPLLQEFELPLAEFPELAPRYKDQIIEVLISCDQQDDEAQAPTSRKTNLLANVLSMPHSIVVEIMDEIFEHMVLFRDDKSPVRSAPNLPKYM